MTRKWARLDSSATTRRHFLTVGGFSGLELLEGACVRSGPKKVAVIPKTTAIDYWDNLRAGAQSSAAHWKLRLSWNAPQSESSYAQQAQMLEDAIRQRVDGIVLGPSHGSVLASAVRHAWAEAIPLVLVDSPVMVDDSEYLAYIGSDPNRMGELAARRVGAILDGRGDMAILGVSPTVETAVRRERAFVTTMKSRFPNIRITDVRYGLSDHIRSREIASDILAARPGLSAFFASDSFATRGAFIALRNLTSRHTQLIGVAQEQDLLSYLGGGILDSLVVQDPYSMGVRSVEILGRALTERYTGPRRIETRVALATKESLSSAEVRDLVSRRSSA